MGFEIFIYILRWVTELIGKMCDLPPAHPSSYFMTSPLQGNIFLLQGHKVCKKYAILMPDLNCTM
jgi:hypothetical protein